VKTTHIALLTILICVASPYVARTQTINIDFGALPGETVYAGSDGVLSSGGTHWNYVIRTDGAVAGLQDEHGTVTAVGLTLTDTPAAFVNTAPSNNLQNSGIESTSGNETDLLISGLDANKQYDIVVYLSLYTTKLRFRSASGISRVEADYYPTYTIPGTSGRDYLAFSSMTPLQDGTFLVGLFAGSFDGWSYRNAICGMQIRETPPNRTPNDIALSSSTVAENLPASSAVGVLSTTDPDLGNTFTYTLVDGAGSADNGDFGISGSTLQTASSFNYETKSNYTVRVRTTDQGSLECEKALQLSITDVLEPPPEFDSLTLEGGDVVLRWSSIANHTYILHDSTSVATGFAERATGIVATPPMNTYTGTLGGASSKFWKVTTEE